MSSPGRDYPLIRGRLDPEPYSPGIVEDLISGLNDWRNVQDIVRLTFKALSDVVKSQGNTVKELELQLPSKAPKSDIAQCLSLKSSYSETIRSLSEVKSILDTKATIDDIYSITEEKVSISEFQYQISKKISFEEVRNMLNEKADLREMQNEIKALRFSMEEINEELHRKLLLCASHRDLQHLQSVIETKASVEEVNEIAEEKANKQSVANALHRKANKADVESVMENKVEIEDFNRLVESLEIMNKEIQNKAERSELGSANAELKEKIERNEFESVVDTLQSLRKESENNFFSHFSNLEGYVASIRSELEEFQSQITSVVQRKSESKDLEKLSQSLQYKSESEISSVSHEFKQEISEIAQSIRHDFHKYQDFCNERALKSEHSYKILQDEISRIHENIRIVSGRSQETIEESIKSLQIYTGNRFDELKLLKIQLDQHQKDLDEVFQKKVDRSEYRKAIDGKAEIRDFQEQSERNEREFLRQIQNHSDDLKSFVLRKERELTLLIDSKPGVHEITSLILESNLNKLKKSHGDDMYFEEKSLKSSFYHDQKLGSFIEHKDFQQSDSGMARWLWQSGEIKSAFAVPWEFECLNNAPENFVWESGNTNILVTSPGIYEVIFAVFSRKRPSIELLVNGEAVLIEFSSQGKTWGRHSDGNVTGACAVEYLALPKRARVSMTYSGESGAKGILSLKKLD